MITMHACPRQMDKQMDIQMDRQAEMDKHHGNRATIHSTNALRAKNMETEMIIIHSTKTAANNQTKVTQK